MLQQPEGQNQLALVTGASRGIGAEIARQLDHLGYHVLLVGRDERRLQEVAKSLKNKAFIQTTRFDDPAALNDLSEYTYDICAKENLELKALINNAGVFDTSPFDSISMENISHQFQVNCFAPMQLTLRLGNLLKQSKGVVVNVSSTLGIKPVPNTSIYSASKAAMNNWTQGLALEWAKEGVRVVGICPGIIDTPIHQFHGEPEESKARKQAHLAQPLGRLGKPEDIASVVSFIVSDKASWITGSLWNVDGGISLL